MPAHPKRTAPRAEANLHGGEALSPLASTFVAALEEISVMSSLKGQLSGVDSSGDVPVTFVSLAQALTAPATTRMPPSAFSTSVDDAALVSVVEEPREASKEGCFRRTTTTSVHMDVEGSGHVITCAFWDDEASFSGR
ncbi:hypothetical protein GN958_ATG20181 [Phytophthora infestans]|uniref:Uncharacterized protein n=1 Tax=Phytophthora infestans TaxID=4787 RepID=A0A8S9TUY4_PHYIN|nr:hypothetical protein GN958_ATG20181 [Phytophthora infestans]